ncbi:hypothetical protein [Mucilaginibacter jinjuensis]|uniref:Uncharacterized protein n=1 Tax=Mucilaginibacter jinjuensis TaxID=1176721 RepID=A0ABY7T944_9SPHI|nr:hypothetical protein [Mucilaginibacter jinjuensis]WCT12946.1 hypothetical protein PQO05_03235 [Mucilaginibacter jinjuensis]
MQKTGLIKYLFLTLSIFLLIVNPVLSVFSGNSRHLHVGNTGHQHHFAQANVHNNYWGLIANRQLISPPHIQKVGDMANLIFAAGFLFFLLSISSETVRVVAINRLSVSVHAPPLYLLTRTLLI